MKKNTKIPPKEGFFNFEKKTLFWGGIIAKKILTLQLKTI